MFKLIKYEIIGRWKFIFSGLLAFILIGFYLNTKVFGYNDEKYMYISLVGVACAVALFLSGINKLNRDLNKGFGYLTFTLPLRGAYIIGAKLIASLLEFSLFCITFMLFIWYYNPMAVENFYYINGVRNGTVIIFSLFDLLTGIVVYSLFMLFAYFSILLSKSILGNKKYGSVVAICIFIFLIYIYLYISQSLINNLAEIHFNVFYYLPWIIGLFFASTYLAEKNLSV